MANTVIQLKNSTITGNVPSSLANGEISINSRDGKFFYSTPSGSVITHYPYLGPAGLNKEIQFNDSGTLGSNSGLAFDKSTGYLTSTLLRSSQSVGDEGGQLDLATAATNNTLVGGFVNIDIFQNKLRIFESGGTNRGVYIDLANGASSGVGTNLLTPSSSTDGWSRNQANAAFLQANTPSYTANSAASYANSAFATANSAASYANSSFLAANTPSNVANSAASYANSAFVKANSAFIAANAAFIRANNSLDANNGGTVNGTITANSFITTGSFGNIQGANAIYANTFIANTGGYIQFSDGSKQYTANAGSGGSDTSAGSYANSGFAVANSSASYANAAFAQANTGSGAASAGSYANSAFGKANSACTAAATAQSTASSAAGAASAAQATADAAYNTNDFALIYTPNNATTITASARRDTFNIVGESGVVAYANSSTKTITVAGTPGAQGLTVDYGFVADPLYYAIDYGTL